MGKPKMTPLAIALRAIEPLSDEERQTVRDMLRPAPKPRSKPKPERKSSQKRKVGKDATAITTDNDNPGKCWKSGCDESLDANIHHIRSMVGYHEYSPASEASKGVGA